MIVLCQLHSWIIIVEMDFLRHAQWVIDCLATMAGPTSNVCRTNKSTMSIFDSLPLPRPIWQKGTIKYTRTNFQIFPRTAEPRRNIRNINFADPWSYSYKKYDAINMWKLTLTPRQECQLRRKIMPRKNLLRVCDFRVCTFVPSE